MMERKWKRCRGKDHPISEKLRVVVCSIQARITTTTKTNVKAVETNLMRGTKIGSALDNMKIHCLVRSTLFVLFVALAVTVLFRRSAATSAPRWTTPTLHSRFEREFLARVTFNQFDARVDAPMGLYYGTGMRA